MTDHLVTVTCPLSTLRTIANALSWAYHNTEARVNAIMTIEALHNDNPNIPAGYTDTIDNVAHYREDAETFRQAYNLAFNVWAESTDVIDPEAIAFYNRWHSSDAEAPQTQDFALSESVSF